MACCNEASYECRDIAGRVGTFCLPRDDVCYATGAQCAGEKAGVAVDEGKACCDAELAECSPWKGDPEASPMPGSYCQKKCYEKDERCIGAPGFPYVVYKPWYVLIRLLMLMLLLLLHSLFWTRADMVCATY